MDARFSAVENFCGAAIDSLIGYRTPRWGKHLELIITDQHSYRSEDPTSRPKAAALDNEDFPELFPQEILETLDAGRLANEGRPPRQLSPGERRVASFRKQEPPQTILGQRQKQWFLQQLRSATRTWKVWGNSLGTFDWRVDPQNLPQGLGARWPGTGYACFGGGGDYGTAYRERAEIYDAIREAGISNFISVSGDRHSFWAGLASKACRRRASSRWAPRSSQARSPRLASSRRMNIAFRRNIRCERCMSLIATVNKSPP